jgi:hypothetical protein
MKLVVNIVLGLVVLLAAAIGGSLLFLPGQVSKQQTVTFERPASTVFALLASMPATYKVNDTLSQKVVQDSVKGISDGLTTELTTADGRTMTAKWTLAPQGASTQVQLAVTENLGMNPIARFQGQSGAQIEPVIKAALEKLGAEAKETPAIDFSSLKYEALNISSRRFIYVEATTQQGAESIKDGIRQSIAIVRASLAVNNLTASGLPIAVETAWEDGKYSFWAGLPYEGPQPLNLIGVKEGPTPAGQAIKVTYEGAEADIIPVYDQMEALMSAARLVRGQSMEVYLDDPTLPGGSKKREIYYFVRTGDASILSRVAPSATGAPALPNASPAQLPPGAAPAPTDAPAPAPVPTPAPAPVPAPVPAPAK